MSVDMMMRFLGVSILLAALVSVRGEPTHCDSAAVDPRAKPYTSKKMKRRAVERVDITDPLVKQADIRGTVTLLVLVGDTGSVRCAKTLGGHPLIAQAVAEAILKWKFRPRTHRGRLIEYSGYLEFSLCNIMCGPKGPSMTILK